MESITLHAMAKINLGLDVLRRRQDGYHEVKMVMQTVNIYDTLKFSKNTKQGIRIIADSKHIPADENNLIYKAASLLYQKFSLTEGVEISLTKRIPIAAGMAGGSTDAAATLVALDRLFELNCSDRELERLGVMIGADVPYCIQGGTVLSEGIGERLTVLPPAPDCHLVVAKPDLSVSTKYVYENLHADRLTEHPDIDGMVAAIRAQNLEGITKRMENVLERVTQKEYPIIVTLKDILMKEGAMNALMSGSGPTVFAIFDAEDKAYKAWHKVKETGLAVQSFVTTFVPQGQLVAEELH